MTEGIAVVLPTRNRPKELHRFLGSMVVLADNPEKIKFYLYVDDDDKVTPEAIDSALQLIHPRIFSLIGNRIIMSDMVNKLLPYVEEDIFFLGGDDLVMRTKGWDSIIENTFSNILDKIALLYGDDLSPCSNFATHPIIHRKWVKSLGYILPPYFSCDYADTWLNELADAIGRKIKIPIVNEHLHWTFGKAKVDLTYFEGKLRFQADRVPDIYNSKTAEREIDLAKLTALIK